MALHSMGIGTCIMQWRAFYKTEKVLKKICGIEKDEAIIAIIGLGYYEKDTKVISAQRMSVDETLRKVGY